MFLPIASHRKISGDFSIIRRPSEQPFGNRNDDTIQENSSLLGLSTFIGQSSTDRHAIMTDNGHLKNKYKEASQNVLAIVIDTLHSAPI